MASARAEVHEHLGLALLDMYEHHPAERGAAHLLQQAEESFRRSLLLEGQPFQPLKDEEPVKSKTQGPPPALRSPQQALVPGGRGRGKTEKALRPPAKGSKPSGASTGDGKERRQEEADKTQEKLVNARSASARIGLAKVLTEKGGDPTAIPPDALASITSLYEESIEISPRDFEAYFKIGELLELKDPKKAAAIY
eukprot:768570-Hanusia_phi.AAC.1